MELIDLIKIAKAYQSLGWAVQEQLDSFLQGEGEECNPNALRLAGGFLRKVESAAGGQEWCEETRQDLIDEITEAREGINSLVFQKRGNQ